MQRKSNKTARVLSLLTTDKKGAPSEEENSISIEDTKKTESSLESENLPQPQPSPEPSEPQKTQEPAPTPAKTDLDAVTEPLPPQNPLQSSVVPPVMPVPEVIKPVSELIRDKLLEEIEGNELSHILPSGSYEDKTSPSKTMIPSVETAEFENFDIPEEPARQEEPDYSYTNVLEEIVKEKLPEYANKFGVCQCNRCLADITALSLTNLPSKYIVADKGNIFPLLNYYTNKYSANVIAEITKACMIVNAHPHHKKKS